MTLLGLLPLVIGAALLVLGVLGLTGRLPLNRFGGVRTPAALRSEEAFRTANKVAGLPIALAGAIGVVGGAVALTGTAAVVVSLVALVGALAVTLAAGILGDRAARAVPEPEPELPAGCAGCQCGTCGVFKKAQPA